MTYADIADRAHLFNQPVFLNWDGQCCFVGTDKMTIDANGAVKTVPIVIDPAYVEAYKREFFILNTCPCGVRSLFGDYVAYSTLKDKMFGYENGVLFKNIKNNKTYLLPIQWRWCSHLAFAPANDILVWLYLSETGTHTSIEDTVKEYKRTGIIKTTRGISTTVLNGREEYTNDNFRYIWDTVNVLQSPTYARNFNYVFTVGRYIVTVAEKENTVGYVVRIYDMFNHQLTLVTHTPFTQLFVTDTEIWVAASTTDVCLSRFVSERIPVEPLVCLFDTLVRFTQDGITYYGEKPDFDKINPYSRTTASIVRAAAKDRVWGVQINDPTVDTYVLKRILNALDDANLPFSSPLRRDIAVQKFASVYVEKGVNKRINLTTCERLGITQVALNRPQLIGAKVIFTNHKSKLDVKINSPLKRYPIYPIGGTLL